VARSARSARQAPGHDRARGSFKTAAITTAMAIGCVTQLNRQQGSPTGLVAQAVRAALISEITRQPRDRISPDQPARTLLAQFALPSAPLLEFVEAPLHTVSAPVVNRIERDRSSSALPPVSEPVVPFRNRGLHVPSSQPAKPILDVPAARPSRNLCSPPTDSRAPGKWRNYRYAGVRRWNWDNSKQRGARPERHGRQRRVKDGQSTG
jgi:hypothetical protein